MLGLTQRALLLHREVGVYKRLLAQSSGNLLGKEVFSEENCENRTRMFCSVCFLIQKEHLHFLLEQMLLSSFGSLTQLWGITFQMLRTAATEYSRCI